MVAVKADWWAELWSSDCSYFYLGHAKGDMLATFPRKVAGRFSVIWKLMEKALTASFCGEEHNCEVLVNGRQSVFFWRWLWKRCENSPSDKASLAVLIYAQSSPRIRCTPRDTAGGKSASAHKGWLVGLFIGYFSFSVVKAGRSPLFWYPTMSSELALGKGFLGCRFLVLQSLQQK